MEKTLKDPSSLQAFSREHLTYEINSLFAAVAVISPDAPKDQWEIHVRNLFIEAVTLHARVLYQFLYWDKPKFSDDSIAAHFFEVPTAWTTIRPAASEHLRGCGARVGKEIAHLSYSRLGITPSQKGWNLIDLSKELLSVLDIFAAHASPSRLDRRVRDRLDHWKEFTGYNNVIAKSSNP